MKFKKIFMYVFFNVLMILSTVCSAQIAETDLKIGDIYFGQNMDEIISKYGDSIQTFSVPPKDYDFLFRGGDSTFRVRPRNKSVIMAHIEEDSNFYTPAGIMIGSSLQDVVNAYGQPDSIGSNPDMDIRFVYPINCKRVSYFTPKKPFPETETFYKNEYAGLHFDINEKDGKVYAITFAKKYDYRKEW